MLFERCADLRERIGERLLDAIFIQAVVNDIGSAASAPRLIGGTPIERRSAPRTASQRHDSSRLVGRAMEFACFGLVAAALALTAFGSVEQALAESALADQRSARIATLRYVTGGTTLQAPLKVVQTAYAITRPTIISRT